MQAIRTRYYGPNNTRGSRIVASCEAGRVSMGYRSELNTEENHRAACELMVRKMGWNTKHYGDMVGGMFGNDYYWVADDKRLKAIRGWVELTRKGTPSGNPWCKPEFRNMVDCLAREQGFFGDAAEWVDCRL